MAARIGDWVKSHRLLACFGAIFICYLLYTSRVLVGYIRVSAAVRSANREAARINSDAGQIRIRLVHVSGNEYSVAFRNQGPKTLTITDPADLTEKNVFDEWGKPNRMATMKVVSRPNPPKRYASITLKADEEVEFQVYQDRVPQGFHFTQGSRLMYVSYTGRWSGRSSGSYAPMPRGLSLPNVTICSNVVFLR